MDSSWKNLQIRMEAAWNMLVFENKDTIYDICDAVRCTKALHMAAQNDFNNASLETLNAAAEILGVKYDKVKRK